MDLLHTGGPTTTTTNTLEYIQETICQYIETQGEGNGC